MKMIVKSIIVLLLALSNRALAQTPTGYTKDHPDHFIPWDPIKPEDILWKKRVWRIINIAELANAPLRTDAYRTDTFPNILLNGIKTGAIKAYADKELTLPLSGSQLDSAIACKPERTCNYPQQIAFYGIKEDWMFDKNVGQMVVRIIALAPLTMEDNKYRALFWLAYSDNRLYLSQFKIQNPDKKNNGLTWDEYFEGRQFSSKITKVEPSDPPSEQKHKKKTVNDEVDGKVPAIWPEN